MAEKYITEAEPSTAEVKASVEDVGARQVALLDAGRRALGVFRRGDDLPAFKKVIATSGAGWYTLLVVSGFMALDQASIVILSVAGPEVTNSLGISPATYASIVAQRQIFVGLVALQFAFLCYRRQSRSRIAKQFAVQYGMAFVFSSFLTWAPAFVLVVGPIGAGGGAVYAVQGPMIMDALPPEGRVRGLSLQQAGGALGSIVGAGLFALLSGAAGFTWRGTFLVVGILFFGLSLLGMRLREPAYGRFDTDRIADLVVVAEDSSLESTTGDPSELKFGEVLRRIWHIPSVPRILDRVGCVRGGGQSAGFL